MEIRIKGFDKNLQCSGMQFEVGKEYKIESTNLELCTDKVFHYCKTLKEVNNYYGVNSDNRFCYITVFGEEVCEGDLCSSNHIKVLREIVGEELDMLLDKINGNTGYFNSGSFNSGNENEGYRNSGHYNAGDRNTGNRNLGNYNTGYGNSGNRNSGDYDSGNWNTGNSNSGDSNTGYGNSGNGNTGHYNAGNDNAGNSNSGHYNTGHYNAGNYNSGHRNKGGWNTGNWNTGDCNTGDFNSCNYSSGFFCTQEPKAIIFNIETDMTVSEFRKSIYYKALLSAPFILAERIEGKLIQYSYKEASKKWWDAITPKNKEIIKSIPNFNTKTFKEITGITIRNKGGLICVNM